MDIASAQKPNRTFTHRVSTQFTVPSNRGWLFFLYSLLFISYACLIAIESTAIAVSVHVLSRFIYIAFIVSSLKQEPKKVFSKFKQTAKVIMNNDAFTFVILCIVSRNSFVVPEGFLVALITTTGALFIVIGGSIKIWAAWLLKDAYFWVDSFSSASDTKFCTRGPYRYLDNPMYTVGYMPAYGLALILFSGPGLLLAFVDQLAILLFNYFVERPPIKPRFASAHLQMEGMKR